MMLNAAPLPIVENASLGLKSLKTGIRPLTNFLSSVKRIKEALSVWMVNE